MVHNNNEWVSEPGTARTLRITQEPHSINETAEKDAGVAETTSHRQEPAAGSSPASEPDHRPSPEPLENAEQRAAAGLSSLSDVVMTSTGIENSQTARMVVYAVVALVGLSLVLEVL